MKKLRIFGLILIALFLVSCAPVVVEETARASADPEVKPIEEVISEPKISLKVLSKKTFSYIGKAQFNLGKKPAGTFLVFEIEIENLNSEPVYITSNDLKLFNNEGKKFVPDTEAMLYWDADHHNSFTFETLNPGIKQKGVVIFDVADPKAEYELRVYDNVFSLLD